MCEVASDGSPDAEAALFSVRGVWVGFAKPVFLIYPPPSLPCPLPLTTFSWLSYHFGSSTTQSSDPTVTDCFVCLGLTDQPIVYWDAGIVEEWRAQSKRGRYEGALWKEAGLQDQAP